MRPGLLLCFSLLFLSLMFIGITAPSSQEEHLGNRESDFKDRGSGFEFTVTLSRSLISEAGSSLELRDVRRKCLMDEEC